jgi:hypothetical protein
MNMTEKIIDQPHAKKINKFMITGYRLRVSIMLQNKQREKHTI